MNIEYMGINIPCKNISGLSFSEKIDDDNIGIIDVELCNTPSNRILVQNMLGEIKIKFLNYVLPNFYLVRDSVSIENAEIKLQIRHKISDILSQNMNWNITMNNQNPADVITAILEHAFDNDKTCWDVYKLSQIKQWLNNIQETIDVCYYQLVDISIRDVLNEICNKLGIILFVDYVDNRLSFFNYCDLPIGLKYNEVFRPYVMKKTESVGDDFYNSFKIGIYPDTFVMQQIRYSYKCSNSEYTDVWFDESDITLEQMSGNQYQVTLNYNKYDVTNSIVYEAQSIWTTDITERRAVTVNVSEKVQKLANYSATTLYGSEAVPAWSVWEDDNVFSDTACCRHTNADGAVKIGNAIVERFYRKQKKLTLDLAKFMPLCNGDILTFENTNYILINQEINDDLSATMDLEELIND